MNNRKKILISPSIIASNLSIMGEMVKGFDPSVIDLLHMDVMDGNFVPNLTFGPGYIAGLKERTSIPLDVHLMIEYPERSIDQYISINPWGITIHYESTRFPARILTLIRDAGIVSGISINPATPVQSLYDLLSYTDMVLIMSVDPGFYGQSFMNSALRKIESLKSHIDKNRYPVKIAVDGGINGDNIRQVVQAGAGILVAGSSAFKNNMVNENVSFLREQALK